MAYFIEGARASSLSLNRLRQRIAARRRGVCDLGVGLLAQAGNAYRARDPAVDAYRHATAQCRDAGGDECGPAPIDVVLDLLRRPLQPRGRSCLLDGQPRACRAGTIPPPEPPQ